MINSTKTNALYRAIEDSNEERVYEHFHASSIYSCPRAQYLQRMGKQPLVKPGAGKILRWEAGHHIEAALRNKIEKAYGELQSNERYTSEDMDLTGEFDNLTKDGSTLIEVKSVHDYALIERQGVIGLKQATGGTGPRGGKEYKLKDTPYIHHEWQNHAYVLLLLKERGIEVKYIDYVYSSLSGRLVVYSTEVSPELLETVKRRVEGLKKAWEQQTPPPCLCFDVNSPMYDVSYKWCNYKDNEKCCEI